jgi:hypothetical protein
MPPKFYGVAQGRTPGVYRSWDDAKRQVDAFKGAKHKSFSSFADAEQWVSEQNPSYDAAAPADAEAAPGGLQEDDMPPPRNSSMGGAAAVAGGSRGAGGGGVVFGGGGGGGGVVPRSRSMSTLSSAKGGDADDDAALAEGAATADLNNSAPHTAAAPLSEVGLYNAQKGFWQKFWQCESS